MPVEVYSPAEIAAAAGVPVSLVEGALASRAGGASRSLLVPHDEAVRLGRRLAAGLNATDQIAPRDLMFASTARSRPIRHPLLPLAVSTAVHAGVAGLLIFVAGLHVAPRASALRLDDPSNEPIRMVFVATPGPGGGGGGGGLRQTAPPPKIMREGVRKISSPVPRRREPKPIVPAPSLPEPKPEPPLEAEQLPVVVAPIVAAPADRRDRIGVPEQTTVQSESRGPGHGGGAGTGTGSGLGSGDGGGIGPGSGGGTGGGPYRPGSGIAPPRLLREVKAEYSDDARRRGISGEVELEIVVRRDGSVGDVRVVRGLGGGLNDRAIQAVRQWRFAPAQRQGSAVDVIVEVAVEFTLR